MNFLSTLRDIPNYICGFGNKYYDKLQKDHLRKFETGTYRNMKIRDVTLRRRTAFVIRSFATAVTAYVGYRAYQYGIDATILWLAGAEILRFGSFYVELQDRREFLKNRKIDFAKLPYQTLDQLCEEADESIRKRSRELDKDSDTEESID